MPRFFTLLPLLVPLLLALAVGMLCRDALAQSIAGQSVSSLTILSAHEEEDPQDDEESDEDAAKEDKPETEKKDANSEDGENSSDAKEGEEESTADSKDSDSTSEKTSDKDTSEEDKGEKSESKSPKGKKQEKNAKPHKVERKPMKIEAELDSVFVASVMEEVALRPEKWSQFKVLDAVEHGTHVKKGDVLIRFDDEKLEKELADQVHSQRLGELALMQEEEEFPRAKRLLKLSFEEAERRYERLKHDTEYYKTVDRPFAVQIANYRYQSAKEDLASQREELDQLLKMYEADELTEETEEIVLRRQRFEVETAELVMEIQTADRDYMLNVRLPRNDESYETALEEAELSFEQAKTSKEIGVTRLTYELEKLRDSRARSVERHAMLLSDKSLMVVRSPADGVVYYGKCVAGKWSQVSSLQAKFLPHGSASANSVLMTIVKNGSLFAESKITEKDLPEFNTGLIATIVPAADKEIELPAKVSKVNTIPESGNKFTIRLDVDLADAPDWLVAGMTGKSKVTVYENESALVIPTNLVQTDEDDEKIKYVMLLDPEEDEPLRRKVKLGRKNGKLVEVLKGLEEGDEIVKEEKEKQ